MKSKDQKRQEALERNSEYNRLTTQQKITRLDLRFGEKQGAKTERARLGLKLIEEANNKGQVIPGAGPQRLKPKQNYQKPKRS
jgi:hypothetical protein